MATQRLVWIEMGLDCRKEMAAPSFHHEQPVHAWRAIPLNVISQVEEHMHGQWAC